MLINTYETLERFLRFRGIQFKQRQKIEEELDEEEDQGLIGWKVIKQCQKAKLIIPNIIKEKNNS